MSTGERDRPEPAAAPPGGGDAGAVTQERRLRRHLGIPSLSAIGFSNVLGSGWLFAALYAAQIAGPAALLAWVAGAVLSGLVSLVMVELGASRPEGGGSVRWPLYASGPLVGTVIGVSVLLSVGGTAAELTAIVQYAGHYVPGIYRGERLTWAGVALPAGLSVVLTALNWFGVRLFGRLNTMITVIKVVVPALTVVLLVAAAFGAGGHLGRLTDHGGFAPYGWAAVLSALAGGGIVYSTGGSHVPVDFSGEARDPRRSIPLAVLGSIVSTLVLYLGLQFAFLLAVPDSALAGGWAAVDFASPFGELAVVLNLGVLAAILYADAVVSPGGSAYVAVAVTGRHTYALAKSRLLPRALMKVHPRWGIPRRALALNFAIVLVFLLPFGGWQDIVSVMGTLFVLLYATSAVAVDVFRRREPERLSGWVPGLRWMAPVVFVLSSEFVYWSGFANLRLALPVTLVGVPLFAVLWRSEGAAVVRRELARGAWVVVWLLALTLVSGLGSFGGAGVLPAPWDTAVVTVIALAVYPVAVRSGLRRDAPVPAGLLD